MELKELIAARGHVKGSISRLLSLASADSLNTVSKEILLSKRQRLIEAFKQYESLKIKILAHNPDSEEQVEIVEENYFNILTDIDQELNKICIMSVQLEDISEKLNQPRNEQPVQVTLLKDVRQDESESFGFNML